ncbi:carbonic anhydrase-related protein 10-like [Acanthaster planci]|uniref:Carbonic anhydrase-related protein 10-like n=1 Tax=Acanthaster planci TaxID=133434 RepID=A0A8B7Z295_ACAPL|nr:carbonic anhydrase-related protein 10-like [Acanthaster planci]
MMPIKTVSCLFPALLLILTILSECAGQSGLGWWDIWQYDGLQGPQYWGKSHSAWLMCSEGKLQSPIDLSAERLLYDPDLQRFEVEAPLRTSGVIQNTGRRVVFSLDRSTPVVRIYSGPLNYRYNLHEIELKFGDDDSHGSEHTVNGKAFPVEVQLTFYNERYGSYDKAEESVQGLVKLGIFVLPWNETSRGLSKLTAIDVVKDIVYRGDEVNVTNFNVKQLLPRTFEYLTYEGSLTIPGCFETVTWIIMNKPLRISRYQLNSLRELVRDYKDDETFRPFQNTFRPLQPLGRRAIRTNVAKRVEDPEFDKACPKSRRQIKYKVNTTP